MGILKKSKLAMRSLVAAGLFVCLLGGAFAQTVTAPAAKDTVKASPDYATETLRDRMDMNQRSDLGFRIYNGVANWSVEEPPSYLTNISFAGGIFNARTTATDGGAADASDANITVLDSTYPGVDPHGTINGALYPINADKYQVFAVRMYHEPDARTWPSAQFFWSKDTVYQTALTPNGGVTLSNFFMVHNNWAYYLVDVPALGIMNIAGLRADLWQGMIDSLRFDATVIRDKDLKIDWIRLVEKGATYERTVTWAGFGGNVDIYLDSDQNAGNGTLGLLAKNVSGGSYTFLAGALAMGNYYVAVAATGTTNFSYSTGYYEVTEQPIIEFTKPSAEGSDQDYANTVWADPWDMANGSDVERAENVNNTSFTTLAYEDIAGNLFTNRTVYLGYADPGVNLIGDPIVRMIHFFPTTLRGATGPIDTSKYHNLVVKMGIAGPSSPNDGSIARVVWKLNSESVENVAKAFIVRHTGAAWLMQKYFRDLRTAELETGAASPSHSGWTGLVDSFRLDPHEFPDGRGFFIDDVKLTADWTADASFTVQWNIQDGDGSSTVSLYYDNDNAGYDGTAIVQNLAAAPGAGSYAWNTSGLAAGTYYLYAVVGDGTNQNRVYAGGPVIVWHSAGGTPVIALSRTSLNFGATAGLVTSCQDVVVSNTGTGTLAWTTASSVAWASVSPKSGTQTGTVHITVNPAGLGAGTYAGTVAVTDPNATNNPRWITINLTVYGAGGSGGSVGFVDSPADEATGIEGSVPVTGWAIDDVEVASVKIYREPVAGEGTGGGPYGLVYIGDAVFVEGARPDVAAAYPNYPLNYRAGWGYMMLTNFLPNGGNGTFRLYMIATDKEGSISLLGIRTITCNNAGATLPFGAIDTPSQGGMASGSGYINYGWVLATLGKCIPAGGSTINAFVDGLPIGHPNYGFYRVDIATLFPGYCNANAAIGYIPIDTTLYANGVHTIVWNAVDSGGVVNGFGSRYFTIQNAGSPAPAEIARAGTQAKSPRTPLYERGGDGGQRGDFFGRKIDTVHDLAGIPNDGGSPVFVKHGFDLEAAPQPVFADPDGVIRMTMPIAGRIEISFDPTGANPPTPPFRKGGESSPLRKEGETSPLGKGGSGGISPRFEALQIVNGEVRPLPIGSSFDAERGILTWQPGPGFYGDFQFVLLGSEDGGATVRKSVKVRIR